MIAHRSEIIHERKKALRKRIGPTERLLRNKPNLTKLMLAILRNQRDIMKLMVE